ncbi:MAG: hypothetical protein PS018_24275 [bacterium]|nr:hypothetical protein [bacterium]
MLEKLAVGIVQTNLDAALAWQRGPEMDIDEALEAESQIVHALESFAEAGPRPQIVVLPELAVPLHMRHQLQSHANALESIIIAGLDYRIVRHPTMRQAGCVKNEALLVLPDRWLGRRLRAPTTARIIGKTYPAWGERRLLRTAHYDFAPDPVVWVFDGHDAGRFAVAICYDFMDLERLAMYRGRIHHLFVLAYNKDVQSFNHTAEALARMAFCNVVVANTGFYGGSLAVSPFREPYLRTIFRAEGLKLVVAQTVELPVQSLHEHQVMPMYGDDAPFKAHPPGFVAPENLLLGRWGL